MLKKQVLLLTTLLSLGIYGTGQIAKGNKMLGFSIGSGFYNNGTIDRSNDISSSTIESDNFGITINPSAGWFISDDLALGFSPSVSFNKQKQVGKGANGNTFLNDELNQYSISLGGFARYYFKGQSNKLRFFGQYNLSLGLTGGKNEGYEYESLGIYVDRYDSKFSGGFSANTGVNIGASKFINNQLAIDFYIGYNYSYTKTNPKGTSNRDYLDPVVPDQTQNIDFEQKVTGHNIILGVGLQVFLEGKKK